MTTNEVTFLALAICAFSLFAGVLAWASWTESRAKQSKRWAARKQELGCWPTATDRGHCLPSQR